MDVVTYVYGSNDFTWLGELPQRTLCTLYAPIVPHTENQQDDNEPEVSITKSQKLFWEIVIWIRTKPAAEKKGETG